MSAMNKANSRQHSKRDRRYKPYTMRDAKIVNKIKRMMRTFKKQPHNWKLRNDLDRMKNDHARIAKQVGLI